MRNYPLINQAVACVVLCLVLITGAEAEQKGDSVNFHFTGRLVQQSFCTINNDGIIDVPFGNVGVNRVSSGEYVQDLDYTLVCQGATANTSVNMMILAAPAVWNIQATQTSVTGLGVRFLSENEAIDLNTALTIDPTHPPHLQAQLVSDPQANLTAQAFTATGTLLASYY